MNIAVFTTAFITAVQPIVKLADRIQATVNVKFIIKAICNAVRPRIPDNRLYCYSTAVIRAAWRDNKPVSYNIIFFCFLIDNLGLGFYIIVFISLFNIIVFINSLPDSMLSC